MNTKIYDLTDKTQYENALAEAVSAIKRGGLVVFPTETVYGLGADATNDEAVKKIFEAKGRPQDNPLIVHFADFSDCYEYVGEVSSHAQKIAEAYMPGPVTVIVKSGEKLSEAVTAGLSTVAVRVPADKYARDFLGMANIPVAAPSANLSGKPSPTKPEYAVEDMDGRADVILCGEMCDYGVESTVVDCTGEKVRILRPGAVTAEELMKIVPVDEASISEEMKLRPKSPGMKYRHYKPTAHITALDGSDDGIVAFMKDVEITDETALIFFDSILNRLEGKNKLSLGNRNNPETAAHEIFAHFRYCDKTKIKKIYICCTDYRGMGDAYMNRLTKAMDEYIEL